MKTLIAYSTKYGATEKIAGLIAEKLSGDVELVNLKKSKKINLSDYETVIIGGAIYAGNMNKNTKNFCYANLSELQTKNIALFISCAERDSENKNNELIAAYPDELLDCAKAKGCLGGEIIFDKMNFLVKGIIKNIMKSDQDLKIIDYDAIDKFAAEIK